MHRSPHRWIGVIAIAVVVCSLGAVCAAVGAPRAHATSYGIGAPIPFQLFPPDNAWNTDVSQLPVDPNSANYIASIGAGTGLHPDFGTFWDGGPIGIPYVVVPGNQAKVPVSFGYSDESDPGPYPIPADAPIEGGASSTGDRHVLVLDADNMLLYEMWDAHPLAGGGWHAGSGAVFDLRSNALRPDGWTSADAAGLPILPGLVRYDEVQAGAIDHALRFTVASTQRAYIYPATHFASDDTDPNLPPMGLRLRLKASYDISGFSPHLQVILRALKEYGMIVADNGADWFVSGTHDTRWNDDELSAISQVKGNDFEVVDTRGMQPGRVGIEAGLGAIIDEGATFSRNGTFSDLHSSSWTATVDYGDGTAARALPLAGQSFALSHWYPAAGGYRVVVRVSGDGGTAGSASIPVTVRNLAPRVHGGADARLKMGVPFRRVCSFSDPGREKWCGWVTYGDGTRAWPLRLRADKTFALLHHYPLRHGRRYLMRITVQDSHGARGVDTVVVTVR